jgi:hypothetical protein
MNNAKQEPGGQPPEKSPVNVINRLRFSRKRES